MSLVIGIVDNDKVIMASDSQVTIGGVRKVSRIKENFKIWHPDDKKDLIMGSVGNVREMNSTKTIENLVEELDCLKSNVNLKTISKKVIKKILEELKEANIIEFKDNILTMKNNYLFAYKKKLYQIVSSGAVIRVDKYTAIGSACNEAIASLNNSEGKDPAERIKLAMDASSRNDIFVDYPLIIGTTESEDFTVIESSDHTK